MSYTIHSDFLHTPTTASLHNTVVTLANGEDIVFTPHEHDPHVVYAEYRGTKTLVHIRADDAHTIYLSVNGYAYPFVVQNEREQRIATLLKETATSKSGNMKVPAPMPGLIKSIMVKNGQVVKKNERLFVLEAMKMENDIKSPTEGIITGLSIEPGIAVEKNFLLCMIEAKKSS
jgi:biotin carboxyl carrier protein